MNETNKNRIIDMLESELSAVLFNYVVQFLDKKITAPKKQQKESNLENIVNKQEPKVNLEDIKELEALLLGNLSPSVKIDKNSRLNSNNIIYSLNLTKRKNNNEKPCNYSISINYEENQKEEKLKILIKNKDKEVYFSEISNKKESKSKIITYSVEILYEDNYVEERLTIDYRRQKRHYMERHMESKEDMSQRVPLKWLNVLPETLLGGVLGFTYLGENFMARRADLTGATARMVDIHESIHTPDEYETRVLTEWIISKVKPKYVR